MEHVAVALCWKSWEVLEELKVSRSIVLHCAKELDLLCCTNAEINLITPALSIATQSYN